MPNDRSNDTLRRKEARCIGAVMVRDTRDQRTAGLTRSVHRALAVLEAIGGFDAEVGIVEVSERVELPVSTVHRLLVTLVYMGFVIQSPETGRYRIGIRAFELGNAFLKQIHLPEVVRPVMRQMAHQAGETVNLAVRDGHAAVYIDQIDTDHILKLFTRTGTRVPLYCTGVGKVLLAGFADDELAAYLAGTEMTGRTPKTITTADRLQLEVRRVRTRRHAIDNEEFERGVRCVAAPIFDHRAETIAAISVSAPSQRLSDKELAGLLDLVDKAADRISTLLGARHREI